MTGKQVSRRLAAIMMADVVGYSRMMGADETGTLAVLRDVRQTVFKPDVTKHHGRIVKFVGDGAVVEFPSVVEAVQCATAIQRHMAQRNGDAGAHIELRIAVNLGDVIIEGTDIFGDGVNVAARLQEMAAPGGVALSGAAHEQVSAKVDEVFADAGERVLKNIAKPVRVFTWTPDAVASAAAAEAPSPALPDKPSIAVLPFDNMSGDADQDHFADGVVEAITAALSRIRSFFVIARTSAFAYKGRKAHVQVIGRELGVAYVLEGSVQRAGDRVRITVQLIETSGGAHLWAEKYDGSISDIFDLQDHITEQVAGAMQPSIRLAEVERARRKPPHDLGAYDYTMRAIRHVWMLEESEAKRALELLDKALAIDPDYPLALALNAWCWAQHAVYTWVDDVPAAQARARALAERATNLSTDDPLILAVLGAVYTFSRNLGAARVLLERAVSIDPNGAWALTRLGWLDVYADRPEPAREYFERSLRLSPLDPANFNNHVGLASTHQVAGDENAAAERYLHALRERPNALWIHRNLAPALYGAGRVEEAKDSVAALMAAYPKFSISQYQDAMLFSAPVMQRLCSQLRALGVPES